MYGSGVCHVWVFAMFHVWAWNVSCADMVCVMYGSVVWYVMSGPGMCHVWFGRCQCGLWYVICVYLVFHV